MSRWHRSSSSSALDVDYAFDVEDVKKGVTAKLQCNALGVHRYYVLSGVQPLLNLRLLCCIDKVWGWAGVPR